MSTVQTLIARLNAGQEPKIAEWYNTGGGCMCIRVEAPDGGHYLIGSTDGPLSHGDYDSDAQVLAFGSGYYAPGNGETNDDFTEVYEGVPYAALEEPDGNDRDSWTVWERENAAGRAAHLTREAYKVADAVLAHRATLRPEPRLGMVGKQVVTVVSRSLVTRDSYKEHVFYTETVVTTWTRDAGYETWTFTEDDSDGNAYGEGREYADTDDNGTPLDADGNEVEW